MGHQIQVFMGPAVVREWSALLEESHKVAWLEMRSASPRVQRCASPILSLQEMGKRELTVAMSMPEDEASLKWIKLDGGTYRIDTVSSPVIEFTRPFIGDAVMRRGRLFYNSGFYDGPVWNDKALSFLNWAKRIFARSRQLLTRDRVLDAYVGKEAAALRDSGFTLSNI